MRPVNLAVLVNPRSRLTSKSFVKFWMCMRGQAGSVFKISVLPTETLVSGLENFAI